MSKRRGERKGLSRAITVTPFRVDDTWYNLHSRRVPEGYEGYVIHDGEYFCLVPLSTTERELLGEAERQVRRVNGLHN